MVLQTEITLFGNPTFKAPQTPMWLDLSAPIKQQPIEFNLNPIKSNEQWATFHRLRSQIEVPFGITEPAEIEKIVANTKRIVAEFTATWFLASIKDQSVVGSIGIVEFQTKFGPVGRLLDVDIAPKFQGCGHGNNLMFAAMNVARTKKLKALCLKCDSYRWVKDWYAKLGFQSVGLWNSNKAIERT